MQPNDTLFRRAIAILVPPRCLICGQAGNQRLDLCTPCRSHIHWSGVACGICAMPTTVRTLGCGHCHGRLPDGFRTFAAFRYAFPVDELLSRFKYRADLAAADTLCRLAFQHTDIAAHLSGALLPIPLHRNRLRTRGFNQSQLIAQFCAARSGLSLETDLLIRQRHTAPQNGLSAAQRRRNLKRAFSATARAKNFSSITLVDDVMTTGSTAHACANALLKAGVAQVQLFVLARAHLE